MPLLRNEVFEKHTESDVLRDEDEVFHCKITNEIFKSYHDFSERMFLCNSMVWTCSMTGKSGLTYVEAEESEKHAIECLKAFPNQLKVPILFLATLTQRNAFGAMAEDIFAYIKDRYFVGENIQACFTSNQWKDCHIISVIAPEEEKCKAEIVPNGNKTGKERHFVPSANLYKYEIEHLDADDNDISEIMIVDSTQLRRVHLNREKVKLFLKQNVEHDSRGVFVVKPALLEKYNIKNVMWETMFDGPLPTFHSVRCKDKEASKKHRQETMTKYLQKNGATGTGVEQGEKTAQLLKVMMQSKENYKLLKRQMLEEKAQRKQQNKENNNKLAVRLREWSKPKEDLELEDHVKLPVPTPVECNLPNSYFGDVLAILEFVHFFKKVLTPKDFFPEGLNLDIMERALLKMEVAGPLTDLVQMFLTAIFNCQEEESNSYNTRSEALKGVKADNHSIAPSLYQSSRSATLASKWANKYQGLPTYRLPLYSLTVSEVLRIHLLSSGARINDIGSKWRYAQRGGYTSEDDPGFQLRLREAHILKALSVYNVVQLAIGDKIKIITCLMNQLLTYADVRDIIDEQLDKERTIKVGLKSIRSEERKRQFEMATQRAKLKKEMAGNPEALKTSLQQLKEDVERKNVHDQKRGETLTKSLTSWQVMLGRDRAYRKYLKVEAVPGLFVNWEDELSGTCMDAPTAQYPELVNAQRSELMAHIDKMFSTPVIQDNPLKIETPASPEKVNGINSALSGTDGASHADLLLCTANPANCPVHTKTATKHTWAFFHQYEQLQDLINALNKRGYREGELKETLKSDYNDLVRVINRTPVGSLNPKMEIKQETPDDDKPVRLNGSFKKKDRCVDANMGYPTEMSSDEVQENVLIENILEMEEKIKVGFLGTVKCKDRNKWRNCLQNKHYDEFEELIKNYSPTTKDLKVKEPDEERSRSSTPESANKEEYRDPGNYLTATIESTHLDGTPLIQSDATKKAIYCLANALSHVAHAIKGTFLKRPLGHNSRSTSKMKDSKDVLEHWMQSLLASTSFSQIFLHLGTLDSCVQWSKSALLARCRICRRKSDSENMLLCDSCNMGHHLYCLKPKLSAVPQGDWFCSQCQKEKEKEQKLLSPEPVEKRRRIFGQDDDEEDEDQASDVGSESMSENDDSVIQLALCKTCGSGGETVECEKCESHFHKECTEPPLRRLPRMPWTCFACSSRMKRNKGRDRSTDNGFHSDYEYMAGFTYSQRSCAVKASRKIHAFAKALRVKNSKSLSSEDDESSFEQVVNRRPFRRDDQRDDLPLHNAALQELLADVMKHESAWPFLRPVQQKEVPDYYEIITEPMDFATLKNKLNMGKYSTDSQLMRDVVLIFENCNTYNSRTDEVYQCGKQLLEYFAKKANEVGLVVPPELEFSEGENRKSKKRRTK
ncbi:bromodomain adjacent to zinc finger domain protein 1A isoform X2 [Dendroctonus ponderosae]|uniref:bromodomain adjacent to zinc finger domain protein 1A isoform X2 n=1 Tax=Dendroctonus ponderosae TaxID=77166 RepID=UPI00203642BD|nr:bromodomain adjacent to zinc finger domain protein 1A isoform X2 [Dendroctonus ponderosae]